jgi:hypothetical protein
MTTKSAEKALSDLAAKRRALEEAEAVVAEVAQSSETEMRVTLGGELEAEHEACSQLLEAALSHIERIEQLRQSLNDLDHGRKSGPKSERGRQIIIPRPAGYRDLDTAIKAALVPLVPVPPQSPTLLDAEVWRMLEEVHVLTKTTTLDWKDSRWWGIYSTAYNRGRSLSESVEVLKGLERMKGTVTRQQRELDTADAMPPSL